MQMMFVDESGTPPPLYNVSSSPFFVLGGVVIPEEYWHRVKADLDIIKKKFSVVGEIKWRYFAPRKLGAKNDVLGHLDASQKEALRSALYQICLLYTSPSPRDQRGSRMPSSA